MNDSGEQDFYQQMSALYEEKPERYRMVETFLEPVHSAIDDCVMSTLTAPKLAPVVSEYVDDTSEEVVAAGTEEVLETLNEFGLVQRKERIPPRYLTEYLHNGYDAFRDAFESYKPEEHQCERDEQKKMIDNLEEAAEQGLLGTGMSGVSSEAWRTYVENRETDT